MQNHLCSAASFEEKPGTRWLQAGDPSVWLYIPTTLPGRAFPKPVAVYEWASCSSPCCNSQPEHCSAPSLQKIHAPTHLRTHSWGARPPRNRLCPTQGSWKAIVRAGRAIPSASLVLLGTLQAAASPGGGGGLPLHSLAECPAPGGAQAEQEPGTGAPEELPCLPVRRDGFAERGGTPASKEQRMQRDKRRYLPGNHYKVL